MQAVLYRRLHKLMVGRVKLDQINSMPLPVMGDQLRCVTIGVKAQGNGLGRARPLPKCLESAIVSTTFAFNALLKCAVSGVAVVVFKRWWLVFHLMGIGLEFVGKWIVVRHGENLVSDNYIYLNDRFMSFIVVAW